MKRPWIVYKRVIGVLKFVARFADEGNARSRAISDGLFCENVNRMSLGVKKALGLKESKVAKVHPSV